ncbi:MAG: hypothetical protein HY456_00160 [Parcubacteria group bacterium]|nr:hypothetical protein [Parcubacteria group bacterium]
MAAIETTIKERIQTLLNQLKAQEVLREVHVDDLNTTSIFDRDFASYPVAILMPASIESDYLTNNQNIRTFEYDIGIIHKRDEISNPTDIEDLRDTIMNKFDNDPTLKAGNASGVADGGVEPSSSRPEPIVSRGKAFIFFSVTIRARAVKDLSFT